jgi:mono/diheme cytochrome c family protein
MYFPGALEIIATGVIPALGAGFLVMLPLLARKFGEDLVHKAALGGVVTGAIGIGVLSWLALAHDAPPSPAMKDGNKAEFERREKFHAVLAEERAIRDYSIARAADGISAGPLSLSGPRLFNSHCRSCHTFEYLKGGGYGDLTGFASAGWIAGLLRKPDAPQYLGKYYTHIPETHRGMMDWVRQQKDAKDAFDKKEKANPPWLSPGQIDDVSEALADIRAHPKMADADRRGEIEALISKPLAEKLGHDRLEAATKALANDCRRCHEIGAKGGGLLTGPSLNGYGTREWLIGIIRNSHDLRFYGESSKMPKFERAQLDERQMDALVDFLLEPRPRRRGEPGRSP